MGVRGLTHAFRKATLQACRGGEMADLPAGRQAHLRILHSHGGEIGRRASLRSWWEQSRRGSSPLHGTIRRPALRGSSWQAIMFQVYVLELIDGSYYVGFTADLARRLSEHSSGIACDHTKRIPMKQLLWSEPQENRLAARAREKEIKGWRREKKERLWKKGGSRSP